MLFRLITFFVIIGSVSLAGAEYRVFELAITDQTTGTTRKVVGTLDDIQYRGYYPVKESEQIQINDTWMCHKNRTQNYQSYCPSPRAPAAAMVK